MGLILIVIGLAPAANSDNRTAATNSLNLAARMLTPTSNTVLFATTLLGDG